MRVLVVGATGRTGRLVLTEALERMYEVVAFARDPSKVTEVNPHLSVVRGNVTSSSEVENALEGVDAVMSVLGEAPGSPPNICSLGVETVVGAMEKHGVRRLIALSDHGNGETRNKGIYSRFLWLMIRNHLIDKEKMERAINESSLEWTIVRATILTNGPKKGTYRTGTDLKVGVLPRISRGDVADFMVSQLARKDFIRAAPSIVN